MNNRFTRGDYLKVTVTNETTQLGYVRPKSVFYGTALEDRDFTGYADFTLEVGIDTQNTVMHIPFNLNQVDVEVLFKADVARDG